MERSWNLTDKLSILVNRCRYAAPFQNLTNMHVYIEVMEFCDTVMEKSWNFVAKISWQPWFGIETTLYGRELILKLVRTPLKHFINSKDTHLLCPIFIRSTLGSNLRHFATKWLKDQGPIGSSLSWNVAEGAYFIKIHNSMAETWQKLWASIGAQILYLQYRAS